MHELAPRFVAFVLVVTGIATLIAVPASPLFPDLAGTHQQLMLTFAGGLLGIAAFVPPLRLPAIGTGLVTKALFLVACAITMDLPAWPAGLWLEVLQIALLAAAGAVLLRALHVEAAWDGAAAWRHERA